MSIPSKPTLPGRRLDAALTPPRGRSVWPPPFLPPKKENQPPFQPSPRVSRFFVNSPWQFGRVATKIILARLERRAGLDRDRLRMFWELSNADALAVPNRPKSVKRRRRATS